MKIIRYQRKRLLVICVCTVLILITAHSVWNSGSSVPECSVPSEVHMKMNGLLDRINDALEALSISYFLCYDSLWGALKSKGPLPWHTNIDLCVSNKEVSNTEEGFLVRTFKRYGLSVSYNSANGVYSVFRFGEKVPTATLTVFEQDSLTRQMRRVGWAHRMLPPDSCEKLHCFPPDLIAGPLSTTAFLQHQLPVPREEIEILKYLFPDSWWKDNIPPDCTKPSSI